MAGRNYKHTYIYKSERCNIELVSAGVCCERGLLLIAVFDWDMPIARRNFHCTEYASLAKTKCIEYVIDPRQRVSILLSDAVEVSIIDAKTPRSIFLPSHDYRADHGELDLSIIPFCNIRSTCLRTSISFPGDIRQGNPLSESRRQ